MDYCGKKKKAIVPSILQSDELFCSKILARQSTWGSSRTHHTDPNGVPFQWEMEPGRPIKPPSVTMVPPISPPPAMLALGFPKPRTDMGHEPEARRWSRVWLVKKIKKRMAVHKGIISLGGSGIICNASGSNRSGLNYGSERYHSDQSGRFTSSSFASTTRSSSTNSSNDKPSSKELDEGKAFTCRPWGFSGVVVYLVKRD